MSWTRDEYLSYIWPPSRAYYYARGMDAMNRLARVSEADLRKAKNRQRVADHFDRLNAQGIALGGAA